MEPFCRDTLASIFALDYPSYEIIFCVADGADPVLSLIDGFIAKNPDIPAQLLIGDDVISGNPKLNNVVKGWNNAKHEWIVLADSNVLMPPEYLRRLFSRRRANTGLVCSPPIGAKAEGFAAYLECAFLNTYQARWQYAAEALGYGFAQGKSMLWRKATLDERGGIAQLNSEIAEDAAATKVVREAGQTVHLVERPFAQPLGRRTAKDVWRRQLRWARMRRATFLLHYLPELVTTGFLCFAAAAAGAEAVGWRPLSAFVVYAALWYGAEALLAKSSGWPLSRWSLPAWIVRDLLLPLVWLEGLTSDKYEWRGQPLAVNARPATAQRID